MISLKILLYRYYRINMQSVNVDNINKKVPHKLLCKEVLVVLRD